LHFILKSTFSQFAK